MNEPKDVERTGTPAVAVKRVVSLGDYVLASKYSDRDPQDPWRVGFVVRIIKTWRPHPTMPTKIENSYIIGEQNGTWSDFREYKCAKKITAAEGKEWLEANTSHHAEATADSVQGVVGNVIQRKEQDND